MIGISSLITMSSILQFVKMFSFVKQYFKNHSTSTIMIAGVS